MEKHGKSEISHTSPQPAGCVFTATCRAPRETLTKRDSKRFFSNGRRKTKPISLEGKRSFPTSMSLYQKALASVFDFFIFAFRFHKNT